MDRTRCYLLVPDCFVVPPPKPPAPPPMPGTVNPEDLRPDPRPPLPFLVPWRAFTTRDRHDRSVSIPCEVDVSALAAFHARHDTQAAVRTFFKDGADADAVTARVMRSTVNPFSASQDQAPSSGGGAATTDDDDNMIVWTLERRYLPDRGADAPLGGRKLKHRHHRILVGQPWSVQTFGTTRGAGPARNVVYGPDGHAIAQVDYGHFGRIGTHAHALVRGNLEHTPGDSDDHMVTFDSLPWFWHCIPDALGGATVPPVGVAPDGVTVTVGGVAVGAGCGGSSADESSDSDADAHVDSAEGVASLVAQLRRRGPQAVPDTGAIDDYTGWVRVNVPLDDFRQDSM